VSIVDEQITREEISRLSIRNLRADDQGIFVHDPCVLTEDTLAALFAVLGDIDLVKVYGDDYLELLRHARISI